MALLTTPKAASAASSTPSRTVSRPEVSVTRPSTSSARVEALKSRLSAPPPQPVAPRQARTSARAADMAKLNKFNTPTPAPVKAATSARQAPTDFSAIEPPPAQPATSVDGAIPPTEATSEEPLSPQYAALARKEQQLLKAQQKFKADQEAWKQEQAKYVSRDSLTSDPLKLLAEAGITPEKLVELQINQAAPKDPQQALLDKIADLESKLQGIIDPDNGALAQRDKQAYEQAVSQIRNDAKLLVDSNPAYGTIKSEGKSEDVVELITSVFDEDGVILDVEEAAQLVEDKLIQNLTEQWEKLSKYEKLQARLRKPAETPEEVSPEQQSPQSKQSITLTNAGSTFGQLSPRDRAILKVQERLNAGKR